MRNQRERQEAAIDRESWKVGGEAHPQWRRRSKLSAQSHQAKRVDKSTQMIEYVFKDAEPLRGVEEKRQERSKFRSFKSSTSVGTDGFHTEPKLDLRVQKERHQ